MRHAGQDRRDGRSRVRCPQATCRVVFEVPEDRVGRNIYCLYCGTRMTARPAELDAALAERGRAVTGGVGAVVARLPLAALLDNVRSLWNVGSMFRTADACGVAELALAGITGCPPRPEIAKTALGAEAVVRWTYAADPLDALSRLAARGHTPVALEATADAVPLHELRWPARPCLVVGNEVGGISAAVLERCAIRTRIPMRGLKDSLNVAVAFGIAAHGAATALAQSRIGVEEGGP